MISVAEAKTLVSASTPQGRIGALPLQRALGYVIAREPVARIDMPPFTNSAMDGFAIAHETTATAGPDRPITLPIVGEQLAGQVGCSALAPGSATRIATGAMLPIGATAVVPLEDVVERDGSITIDRAIACGSHVRRQGEESRCGDVVLEAGTCITPAVMGYLAGLGVSSVSVYLPPTVALLPTGSELVTLKECLPSFSSRTCDGEGGTRPALPGGGALLAPVTETLAAGQQYDSNSVALRAALTEFGIDPYVWPPIPDDRRLQATAITEALARADILVITGGVSVGKADYVKSLLLECGVATVLWGVRQKPGKPFYCGRRGSQLIFGLPGNPVSTLVAYYEYVRLAIRQWLGHAHCDLPTARAFLTASVKKTAGRAHFLRAETHWCDGRWATRAIGVQESHRMRPLALANSLIVLPEACGAVAAGDTVEIHWLPPMEWGPRPDGLDTQGLHSRTAALRGGPDGLCPSGGRREPL